MFNEELKKYTALDKDQELTQEEFFKRVEGVIRSAKATCKEAGYSEEIMASVIIGAVTTMCYCLGVQVTETKYPQEWNIIDRSMDEAFRLWDLACMFCKNRLDIEFHPFAMAASMYSLADGIGSEEEVDAFKQIIKRALDRQCQRAEKDIKPLSVKTTEEIEASLTNKDNEELIKEYFDLMEKLGTFYADRDRYESDEKREIHDRLIAIYNKIIGTPEN